MAGEGTEGEFGFIEWIVGDDTGKAGGAEAEFVGNVFGRVPGKAKGGGGGGGFDEGAA